MTGVYAGARPNGRNGSGGWCDAAAAYPYREDAEGQRAPARRTTGLAQGPREQAPKTHPRYEQADSKDYHSSDNRGGGSAATAANSGRDKAYLFPAISILVVSV